MANYSFDEICVAIDTMAIQGGEMVRQIRAHCDKILTDPPAESGGEFIDPDPDLIVAAEKLATKAVPVDLTVASSLSSLIRGLLGRYRVTVTSLIGQEVSPATMSKMQNSFEEKIWSSLSEQVESGLSVVRLLLKRDQGS